MVRSHRKLTSFTMVAATSAVGALVTIMLEEWRLFALALVILAVCAIVPALLTYRTCSGLASRLSRSRAKEHRISRHIVGQLEMLEAQNEATSRRVSEEIEATSRRVSEEIEATSRRVSEEIGASVTANERNASDRAEVLEVVFRDLGQSMAAVVAQLDQQATVTSSSVREVLNDEGITERLESLRHAPVTEVDALLQLHRRVELNGAAPLVWGWAMSPRGILQLVDLITEHDHRHILECGPGTSTVYAGRVLQEIGAGRITSLEHQPEHAEATRAFVRRFGLEDVVDVRLAPLVEVDIDGEPYSWYDPSSLDDLNDIDLVVVDGPPGATGRHARFPAFPLVVPHLAERATIVVDDTTRRDERVIVKRWLADDRLTRALSATPDQSVLVWSAATEEQVEDDSSRIVSQHALRSEK